MRRSKLIHLLQGSPSIHEQWYKRHDKTRQRQESDRSRRQPEGSFFVSFYRNLRYQPQLTAGGGATPLPLRAQLVPSNTGTHFTYHEWMES